MNANQNEKKTWTVGFCDSRGMAFVWERANMFSHLQTVKGELDFVGGEFRMFPPAVAFVTDDRGEAGRVYKKLWDAGYKVSLIEVGANGFMPKGFVLPDVGSVVGAVTESYVDIFVKRIVKSMEVVGEPVVEVLNPVEKAHLANTSQVRKLAEAFAA